MKKIFSLAIVFFLIDVISKLISTNLLVLNESVIVIKNFFSLTYVKNYGAAWSMLNNHVSLLVIITFLIIVFLVYYLFKKKDFKKIEIIGYALILSGALGNLFDRVYHGYVIDFLDFNLFGYNYPIFNLADTFIVIGVILLFIDTIFMVDNKKNN